MTRKIRLVVGLVVAGASAFAVALFVGVVAVMFGAAPLGLAGESTPTQPWVPPVVALAGVATLVVGVTRAVRRFRDSGTSDQPRPALG